MQAEFVEGVAHVLTAGGVGVWRPDGAYAAGEIGITDTAVPDQPDGLITLTCYPLADDQRLGDSTIGLQVRTRMPGLDPRPTAALDDEVFGLLQGRTHLLLDTGVHVVSIVRASSTPLGQDTDGRWSRSSNYTALVHWAGPHRD